MQEKLPFKRTIISKSKKEIMIAIATKVCNIKFSLCIKGLGKLRMKYLNYTQHDEFSEGLFTIIPLVSYNEQKDKPECDRMSNLKYKIT